MNHTCWSLPGNEHRCESLLHLPCSLAAFIRERALTVTYKGSTGSPFSDVFFLLLLLSSNSSFRRAGRSPVHHSGINRTAAMCSYIYLVSSRGVGCILYEMATGRPMFPGATVKEELHLIFRLMGKSSHLPQTNAGINTCGNVS